MFHQPGNRPHRHAHVGAKADATQTLSRIRYSHYSFIDPQEARFITPELMQATCLTGTPETLTDQIRALEEQGLNQIMLYPPLNRQYRVIEDFADRVMSRL